MNEYYVPINGYVEVEARNEEEAYQKAREMVKGFEYECGEAYCMSEDIEED